MSVLIILVLLFIFIAILGYLLKSFIQVVLVAGLIFLLFHIGYVWSGDDLKEHLHIDKWMDDGTIQKVEEHYQSFSKKREELAIVDTKKIQIIVKQELQEALSDASDQKNKIDKQELYTHLSKSLQNYDSQSVKEALNGLREELKTYDLTPEEMEQNLIIEKTK
mgnify:CR=1 FL=1